MDPNDPNNTGNQSPPQDPNAGDSSAITLESLYGPSTPAADTGAQAPVPPAPEPSPDSGGLPGDQMANAPSEPAYPPMDQNPDPMAPVDAGYQMGGDYPVGDPNAADMPQDTGDQNYYQEVPQDPGLVQDYNQLATEPGMETEQLPVEEEAPVQQEAAYEPAQGGEGLPPVPSSSKKPLIIIGIVVLILLVIGGTTTFFLLGSKRTTPSPTPSVLDTPLPCDEDPENPDCQGGASPSITPVESATPFNTSTPLPSTSVGASPTVATSPTPASSGIRSCQLLGTCP